MKRILEKFRSVPRYLLAVYLAAAACFSGLAENDIIQLPGGCTAIWNEEMQGWLISCQLNGIVTGFIPGMELGGGCTNCVQMSPSDCSAIKSQIIQTKEEITTFHHEVLNSSNKILEDCDRSLQYLTSIQDEGDHFTTVPVSAGGASRAPDEAIVDTVQYQNGYLEPFGNGRQLNGAYFGGVNSIYNYYNDGLKQQLVYIRHDLEDIRFEASNQVEKLDYLYSAASAIEDVALTMNCTACSNGSGSGSSDPSSPSGCPCSDLIQKVVNAAESTLEEVKKISQKVEAWDAYIKYLKQILDNVKELNQALSPLGTNYNYAVQYKNLDGVTFQMSQLDKLLHNNPGKFDFGEFGKLSWFSRVEYLLLSIAGVFSETNSNFNTEQLDGYYDGVADQGDTLSVHVQATTTGFESAFTAYRALCTSFRSGFSGGSSANTLNLFPSWFDGRGLLVEFPAGVISTARAVTSLFWAVLFACLLFEFCVHFWMTFFFFVKDTYLFVTAVLGK